MRCSQSCGRFVSSSQSRLGVLEIRPRRSWSHWIGTSGSRKSDRLALKYLEEQSWEDMIVSGLVKQLVVSQPDLTELELSIAFMGHERLGEILVGADDFSRADREASNRVRNGSMVLVGIDGDSSQPFRQERLALQQGGETYPVQRRRFVYVGSADAGKIADKVRFAGAMVIDPAIDLSKPFSILYNTGGTLGEFGTIAAMEYTVPPIPLALAQGTPVSEELLLAVGEDIDELVEDNGTFASMMINAPWSEVVALLVLMALVMTSFLRKSAKLRWVTLAYTLIYLGFMDGGFVSVSHITNGIKLGPSMFLNDLPLLLILIFTVVTTLFWGRVFCSSLCPFGALQDFIAYFMPRHFQK